MQDRLCLYEIVWDRIYGTKEQYGEFKTQWVQARVNEINAILERGINWNNLTWTTTEELEELYKPLPVFECGCAGQQPIFQESCSSVLSKISPATPECQTQKRNEKVFYGTPELESKVWGNRLASFSPELQVQLKGTDLWDTFIRYYLVALVLNLSLKPNNLQYRHANLNPLLTSN